MKRKLLWILTSFVLGSIAFSAWIRGLSGVDEASLSYDRYRSDGRAASDGITLRNDRRIWIILSSGHAPRFDGSLVRGYHVNADDSGGIPRLRASRMPYAAHLFDSGGSYALDAEEMKGWGPLRFDDFHRSGNGEEFRSITLGISPLAIAIPCLALGLFGSMRIRRRRSRVDSPSLPEFPDSDPARSVGDEAEVRPRTELVRSCEPLSGRLRRPSEASIEANLSRWNLRGNAPAIEMGLREI